MNHPPYSGAFLQFIWANFAYLICGKLRLKKGSHPPDDHPIPADLFCVGVATSADPAVDDAVIGYLNDLGVRQVRVDFTYGDADNHVARLLDRLAAERFSIMLHLVQPLGAARNMLLPDAQDEWRTFVVATLERFGDRIEFVEIGSTINRKRWAGYTLDGFLEMWGIAHDVVRARRITLAGTTPFSPPSGLRQGYDRQVGLATGSFTGLNPKSKFLAFIGNSLMKSIGVRTEEQVSVDYLSFEVDSRFAHDSKRFSSKFKSHQRVLRCVAILHFKDALRANSLDRSRIMYIPFPYRP